MSATSSSAPGTGLAFTDEQRAAIEHRGGLLLTANAGSGKTSVMAERFVRAAREDGVDVGRILAITFTEKAAAELKGRVRGRFEALGDDERARATEGAWVSTIHGLCARLLRTHPLAAGIDPRFRVLDEHGARRVATAAFATALDELVEAHGTAALELIAAYRPAELEEQILDLHGELRSRGEEAPSLPAPRPASLEARRLAVAMAREAAARELVSARDGKAVERARRALAGCGALLERTAGVGREAPDPGEVAALALPRSGKAFEGPGCQAYREALDGWAGACADARAVPVHGLLDALLQAFARAYADAKAQRSVLDFEDLELRANRLLREHEELRARYAERFVHVMVDEFQDTNPLQLELLERIAGDRLFTVGDELQSIYGFRHADVALFRRRRKALAERGQAATLATNFRSHRGVLDALNVAFRPRFGDSFVPLVAGRAEPPDAPAPDGPRIELLITDRDAGWDAAGLLPEGAAAPAPLWRIAEARALAARIRALLDAGRPPGDVVVLLRATGDLAVYERALTDLGVPTYVIGGRGYWSQQQVRDLVCYLAVLANPRDGVALLSLLASPLVGLSSDGLVALAATTREQPERDPWQVLTAPPAGDPLLARLAPEDGARVRSLRAWLPAERLAAPRHSLESLLNRVLERTGYDVELLRLPGGARRMANVRKLMRLAREHEAEHGRDLRGFVDLVAHLGGDSRADDRESEAPVEGDALEAVRLMTIHRSKGLEFPVVCVADLGRESPSAGRDIVRVDKDGRVGIKLKSLDGGRGRPALAYTAIGEQRQQAEADEEARLFYVAMTRAREQLVLSGALGCAEWPAHRPGAAPLSWIAPAFVPDIARLALPEAEASGVAVHEGIEVAYTINRPSEPPEPSAAESSSPEPSAPWREPASPAPALADPVRKLPGSAAPPPRSVGSPASSPLVALSYTALSEHLRCGYRFYLERVLRLPSVDGSRAAGPSRSGLAGNVRGRIVHDLLEHLDLARGAVPSEEEIRRAAARARAGVGEAEAAELAGLVAAFLDSPLCARLAAIPDLRREQAFVLPLRTPEGAELPLTGVFDAIGGEGTRTLVVDYKSDRLGEDGDPHAAVDASYALQREAYALAALRDGAEEVEIAHVFLERPLEPVAATYGRQDAAELERRLGERADRVLTRDFPVAPDPQPRVCDGCPGRGSLCSWPLERTRGAEGRLF